MIATPEYCVAMARYNAWQNRQLRQMLDGVPQEVLTEERGAFFGSILGTLNHILWADRAWLSRLSGSPMPPGGMDATTTLTPTLPVWSAERFRTDGALLRWAEGVHALGLVGPLRWTSLSEGREISAETGLCAVHMFNHQTHHRGQVHAMMTAAGLPAPVTDLVLMPQEGPWP